jgi:hypothetical protein
MFSGKVSLLPVSSVRSLSPRIQVEPAGKLNQSGNAEIATPSNSDYAVDNRRHKACMFNAGQKNESVIADRELS